MVARSIRLTAGQETATRQPIGNYRRGNPRPAAPANQVAQPDDFFSNPFNDPVPARPQRTTGEPAEVYPTATAQQDIGTDGFSLPPNALRESGAFGDGDSGSEVNGPGTNSAPAMQAPTFPQTNPEPVPSPEPTQVLPPPTDESMRGLLGDPKQNQPAPEQPAPGDTVAPEQPQPPSDPSLSLPSDSEPSPKSDEPSANEPSAQDDSKGDDQLEKFLYENPFDADRNQRGQAEPKSPLDRPDNNANIKVNELSCDEFRERIARETIDRISLDPSPPFRPDLFEPKTYQRARERFDQRQSSREWKDIDGNTLATGKLVDLAYENIIIETDSGQRQELFKGRLSEGDIGYLSDNWGLPKECLIENVAFNPRSWTPMTMTWKASNACSKTRYFEEVNLERYGHSMGPWLQPVVSSAHFFANIAVTPYKMGIHPPHECQYALGYYRPGNCAPWIVPPVPISARGALTQGAAMTGAFWLIP